MTNSYLRLNRLFLWCALAAVPSGLYAADVTDSMGSSRPVIPGRLLPADGVVYIDQNHALGGGVTPGDAAGFPVTISQSGSYRLSGNLTVPDLNTTAICHSRPERLQHYRACGLHHWRSNDVFLCW
jgi:hypothetical protein